MNISLWFDILLLPIVQGFTEFLPISSSGHISLLQMLVLPEAEPNLQTEIWLHAGSLIALVAYFWKDLSQMVVKTLQTVFISQKSDLGKEGLLILLATVFTVPTALISQKYLEAITLTPQLIGITLLITAGLIVLSNKNKNATKVSLTPLLAIALGVVQGLAVFPGISRSGLTIAFLLLAGFQRTAAARISFLLALPTILGAVILSASDLGIPNTPLLIGTGVSVLASWAGIVLMMKSIEKYWIYFAPYCAAVGLGILIFIK